MVLRVPFFASLFLFLATLLVLSHAAVIVEHVTVEDISTSGVDMSWAYGTVPLAVNFNGPTTTIGNAKFVTSSATSSSDVSFFGLVNTHTWQSPVEFGSTSEANALESIVSSANWNSNADLGFTLHSVPIGHWRLTLPQVERCCDRGFSIAVNSVVHYSCFNSNRLDGQDADDGQYIVIDFYQTIANEDIEVRFKAAGCSATNNDPTIHAFALKALDDDYFNQPVFRDGDSQICPLHTFGHLCTCDATTLGSVTENPVELESLETRVEAGNLIIVFNEPRKYRYKWFSRPDIAFLDKAGEEDPDAYLNCYSKFSWTVDLSDTTCTGVRKWTGTAKMTDVFNSGAGCRHEAPVEGELNGVPVDIVKLFLTVQNAESVELVSGDNDDETGQGAGTYVQREVTHSIPFNLAFEKEVEVEANGFEFFSGVVTSRALVSQLVGFFDGTSSVAYVDIDIYTNVQKPYKLQYNDARPAAHTNGALTVGTPTALVLAEYSCEQDNTDCETVFRIRFTDDVGQCNFDGDYTLTLDVVCNLPNAEDCALDGSETVTISFTLDTGDNASTGGACAAVALEEVQLENEFKSYKGTNFVGDTEENFVDGASMFFRAEIWSPSTSLKSAILSDVTISGGNIVTPIKLFENGGVVDDADTVWSFAKVDDLNKATDPKLTSSRLYPYFSFLALAENMSVGSRDRSTVSVTAVYDIVYTAEISTSSNNELRTESVLVSRQQFTRTLTDETSSPTETSTEVGIRGVNAPGSSKSSTVDPSTTSNIAFLSISTLSGIMVIAALFMLIRAKRARERLNNADPSSDDDCDDASSSTSNLMLNMEEER